MRSFSSSLRVLSHIILHHGGQVKDAADLLAWGRDPWKPEEKKSGDPSKNDENQGSMINLQAELKLSWNS